ncbi:MAG: GGDEF domain-containing protein [Alphaproteobacteria bacterium]|nr:GGDEF domain-containing protein [Alphaproteobacteria bacterium]
MTNDIVLIGKSKRFRAQIKELGYNVITEPLGMSTEDFISEHNFDIIMFDKTCNKNLELCKKVKANSDLLGVSVFFTDIKSSNEIIKALTYGADFIHNLSNKDILKATVSKALSNKKSILDMSKLALTDSLTGFDNKRSFEAFKKVSTEDALSIFYIDVNDFKYVNDTYGHSVGDEVLKQISKRLKDDSRKGDLLFRDGGDEFVLVTPKVQEKYLPSLKKRVEESVSQGYVETGDGNKLKLNISVGAINKESGEDFDEILKKACENMRKNKAEIKRKISFVRCKGCTAGAHKCSCE